MSGRKVFTAGEVLQAADVNDYLMDQSVMVFAGTAARGSAIPSPSEGMVTYRSDDDVVEVFDGSVFAPVGVEPAILQVVSTTKTDTFTTTSTSFVTVTGLTATITPSSASSKVLIMGSVTGSQDVGSNGFHWAFDRGGTLLALGGASGSRTSATSALFSYNANALASATGAFLDTPSSTSALTYSIKARVDTATGFVNRTEADGNTGDIPRTVSTITVMEVAG